MACVHDRMSVCLVDAAEIDILLVGDSLAMVELGYDTTLPVTVDEMLYHCKVQQAELLALCAGMDHAQLDIDNCAMSYACVVC